MIIAKLINHGMGTDFEDIDNIEVKEGKIYLHTTNEIIVLDKKALKYLSALLRVEKEKN